MSPASVEGPPPWRRRVIDLTEADWSRCLDLVEGYADLRPDLMDASIVAVAERLGVGTVATLNHRDFAMVRPRHLDAPELLPWIGAVSPAPLPARAPPIAWTAQR